MNIIKKIYILFLKLFDKIFGFKFMDLNREKEYLIYKEISDYSHIDISDLNKEFREKLSFLNAWKNDTYIFCYPKKCYIDPEYGWIITQEKELPMHAIPNSYRKYEFGSEWGETPKPNSFFYYKNRRKAHYYKEIISLNYQGGGFGTNYFFFYDQLIGQLLLLESKGIDITIPVLIDENIYQTSFFQEALKISTKLNQINWIVRNKKDYLLCEKVYTARVICYQSKFLKPTSELFSSIKSTQEDRKIFMTRSKKRKRHISNKEEIEEIAKSLGFEIIDNDNLSLSEQISIYKSCSKLIALHGAGNINIIHRYPKKMDFMEIQTPDYLASSYCILAKEFGFTYQGFIGSKLDSNNAFYIDPKDFENKVIQWQEKE